MSALLVSPQGQFNESHHDEACFKAGVPGHDCKKSEYGEEAWGDDIKKHSFLSAFLLFHHQTYQTYPDRRQCDKCQNFREDNSKANGEHRTKEAHKKYLKINPTIRRLIKNLLNSPKKIRKSSFLEQNPDPVTIKGF